jgi:putative acetyltransferase
MPDTPADLRIVSDDLSGSAIRSLLQEHLAHMHYLAHMYDVPPESVHALDLAGLRAPDVTFWSVWSDDLLVGCGALKELDVSHGEVKSMRTPANLRRRGAGRAMLEHIIRVARERGYRRLSLETGPMDAFEPARRLYAKFGFTFCAPFGDYVEDPNSVFMTLELPPGGEIGGFNHLTLSVRDLDRP